VGITLHVLFRWLCVYNYVWRYVCVCVWVWANYGILVWLQFLGLCISLFCHDLCDYFSVLCVHFNKRKDTEVYVCADNPPIYMCMCVCVCVCVSVSVCGGGCVCVNMVVHAASGLSAIHACVMDLEAWAGFGRQKVLGACCTSYM